MQTSIVNAAATRITGWPIPFLSELYQVNQTVKNEVFGPNSLALLGSRIAALIAAYVSNSDLDPSAMVVRHIPAPVQPADPTQAPVVDPNAYFRLTANGCTQFDVMVSSTL